ncbi:hypothetical protein KDK95_23095 [Actinospica sp. MGRD01-02]|uniref:Uncharacterized protein n=1 Tax=Actinospica acidithermotolerans TaxID=2828514 RepID=A0A941ILM5_9ACTN|nr:hypothetical protein [Actinospica acidithermotolerans]MBR7829213.1 hypothetical protein [Actinospica acidithermotolerans]
MHFGGTTARAFRAALFALVCVGTGTELHRLANGSDPGWVGPMLALPIVWLAAYGFAHKERSPLTVTAALGLGQLGLHVELGWFCPKTMPGMPGYAAGTDHGAAAMILAHALAVLVGGWWLGSGERGFFDLCRAVGLLVAPAADLLAGRFAAALGVVPPSPLRRGIHVTARRTTSPPAGPAPSPRVLRGPPAFALLRMNRRCPVNSSM